MTIRKRSALLLGLLGFFSGVAFVQYRRARVQADLSGWQRPARKPLKAPPAVPMQVIDESLSTAREQGEKASYTTH